MTIPNKPKSRLQKYILTSKGRKWLEENPEEESGKLKIIYDELFELIVKNAEEK
jgi:hypothetical protein